MADAALLAAVLASFVATCLISVARGYMWYDEIISWQILNRPDFGSMWAAVSDLIGGPPVYFLLAAGWRALLGTDETTLRLLTTLSFVLAFAVVWTTTRRGFGFWSTAFGLLAAFCTSWTVIGQIPEIRYYGVLTAGVALAFRLYVALAADGRPSALLLAANAVVQAFLVMTHVYGGVYGAALLGALLAVDVMERRFRPLSYLSFPMGWAAFIGWLPAFHRQGDVVKPHAWMQPPTPKDLTATMGGIVTSMAFIVLALVVLATLVGQAQGQRTAGKADAHLPPDPGRTRMRRNLVVGAVALACVPFASFVLSHVAEPIFMPRYLLASVIGWGVLFTFVAAWFDFDRHLAVPAHAVPAPPWQRIAQGTAATYVAGLLALPPAAVLVQPVQSPQQYAVRACRDLPVVVMHALKFMQTQQYLADRERYTYVLDWDAAMDPGTALHDSNDFKILRNFKEHVPHFNIVDSADFLATHSRFLVAEERGLRWVDVRLRYSDDWRVSRIGTDLLLVERADTPTYLLSSTRNRIADERSANDPCEPGKALHAARAGAPG